MKQLLLALAIFAAGPSAKPDYSIQAIRYATSPGFPVGALVIGAPKEEKTDIAMGSRFAQWFGYLIVVGVFAGYIAGRALPRGAHYLAVFRFAGCTAFVAYGLALWQNSIWYSRSWATTMRSTIDALIYGLLTAGVFGWLWPR